MNKIMGLNKKLLSQYSTPRLKVYTVNQTAVCKHHISFVGGGHGKVYSFIPDGEIWIAENLSPIERKYFIYHELYEHRKMSAGLSYEVAHEMANKVESKARNSPESTLDSLIKLEMERNNEFISERSHFNGTINLHKGSGLHHSHKRKIVEKDRDKVLIMVYAK